MKWLNGILKRSTKVIEQKDGDRSPEMPITAGEVEAKVKMFRELMSIKAATQQSFDLQQLPRQQQQYQQVQRLGYDAPNALAQLLGPVGPAGLGPGIGSAFGIEPPRKPKKEIDIPIQQPTGKRKIKLVD